MISFRKRGNWRIRRKWKKQPNEAEVVNVVQVFRYKPRLADEQYLDLQKQTLPGLISRKKPNFIFYLAGVDVLASDKLGKMALTIDHAKDGTGLFFEQCIINKIPVQVSMGGGYSPDIKDIVNAHCNTYRLANEMYF